MVQFLLCYTVTAIAVAFLSRQAAAKHAPQLKGRQLDLLAGLLALGWPLAIALQCLVCIARHSRPEGEE